MTRTPWRKFAFKFVGYFWVWGIALTACTSPTEPGESTDSAADSATDSSSGSTTDSATSPSPGAPTGESTSTTAYKFPRPPCPDPKSSDRETVETRCDGIDNDCDGIVDMLLPIAENRCAPKSGACTAEYAYCEKSQRVCQTVAGASEVYDDADNDCNGTVDDVTAEDIHPRAILLVPPYLVTEKSLEIGNVTSFFEQWGVLFDKPDSSQTFEDQLLKLTDQTLAIMPGYITEDFLTSARIDILNKWVSNGGILVVFKPVLTGTDVGSKFLGLSGSTKRPDAETLIFDGAPMMPTRLFDSPEEYSVPFRPTTGTQEVPPDVWLLQPLDNSTSVGAHALISGKAAGAVVTRRAVGKGAIYAVGHDLHTFAHDRCYVNCFEPSGDLSGLFLREAFRESARGHVLLKHTVPGPEDSLAMLTHDVDAPDANNTGDWGKPGAEQIAEMEREHDAKGSYFVTTDYVIGYYSPSTMKKLCELGMCPVGAHSVHHGNNQLALPLGTCTETRATYGTSETLCGEVRVSLEILESDTNHRPRSWRAPYLSVNTSLYDVLEKQGVLFDSSYAVGEMAFNLPVSLAKISVNQFVFHNRALYSMPISLEDGVGALVNGEELREEMSADNAQYFEDRWRYTMLRNADNGAYTLALLHPSYGKNAPIDNIKNKLEVERAFLDFCDERGVKTDATTEDVVDFWRAREATDVDASYKAESYQGWIHVGPYPIRNLTLEFGDTISSFKCQSCGDTTIKGNRVVLTSELPKNANYQFQAIPGK